MAGDYSEHRVRTILQVTRKGPAGWIAIRKVVGGPDIVGNHSCWRGQRNGQFRLNNKAKELGVWIPVYGLVRTLDVWGTAASGCRSALGHLDAKTVLDVELAELDQGSWPTIGEDVERAARVVSSRLRRRRWQRWRRWRREWRRGQRGHSTPPADAAHCVRGEVCVVIIAAPVGVGVPRTAVSICVRGGLVQVGAGR
eukprot:scaffold23079_cov61-Phaeocystis_antarctica.AAC.1